MTQTHGMCITEQRGEREKRRNENRKTENLEFQEHHLLPTDAQRTSSSCC